MAIMDPLLNTGFLWRCLAAYAGIKSDNEPPHDELASATIINTTDNSLEKQHKIDIVSSSPSHSVSDPHECPLEEPIVQHCEHTRETIYYARLGI
jgi:hypothetical protein